MDGELAILSFIDAAFQRGAAVGIAIASGVICGDLDIAAI